MLKRVLAGVACVCVALGVFVAYNGNTTARAEETTNIDATVSIPYYFYDSNDNLQQKTINIRITPTGWKIEHYYFQSTPMGTSIRYIVDTNYRAFDYDFPYDNYYLDWEDVTISATVYGINYDIENGLYADYTELTYPTGKWEQIDIYTDESETLILLNIRHRAAIAVPSGINGVEIKTFKTTEIIDDGQFETGYNAGYNVGYDAGLTDGADIDITSPFERVVDMADTILRITLIPSPTTAWGGVTIGTLLTIGLGILLFKIVLKLLGG